MTLFSASRATEGLVSVRLWRAAFTRAAGSLMKCLADIVVRLRYIYYQAMRLTYTWNRGEETGWNAFKDKEALVV